MCKNPLEFYCFVVLFRLKHKKINPKTNNKIKGQKNFGLKEILGMFLGQQKFGKKEIGSKRILCKKNDAKRDHEGAVCNSGIGMLFFMYLICLHYFSKMWGGGVENIF